MSIRSATSFKFGDYQLVPAERLLLRNGVEVRLQPRAFEILVILVSRSGAVVTKEELMRCVWDKSFVEEANIQVHISAIRKALGAASGPRSIETLPKVGYRFSADVQIETFARPIAVGKVHPSLTGEITQRRKRYVTGPIWVTVTVVILLAGGIAAVIELSEITKIEALNGFTITKITTSGNDSSPTVSPDGSTLAFVHTENRNSSVMLRSRADGYERALGTSSADKYDGLVYSPKGDALYATRSESAAPGAVYRIEIPGGEATLLTKDVYGRVSFSPDGERFAFIRVDSKETSWSLMTANKNGSDEKLIARSIGGELFRQPAWSPKGNKLAAFKMNFEADSDGNRYSLVEVDIGSGSYALMTEGRWNSYGDLAWSSDGSTLWFVGSKQRESPAQIWRLDHDSRDPRQVTGDTDNYAAVAVDGFSGNLVATKKNRISSIWLAAGAGLYDHPIRVNTSSEQLGVYGVAFAGDDGIFFTAKNFGRSEIWKIGDRGTRPFRYLASDSNVYRPVPIPESGDLIYSVESAGGPTHIWKTTSDGSTSQLTNFLFEDFPAVSPDGEWLFYVGAKSVNDDNVWKLSLKGGEPVLLAKLPVRSELAISPDGSRLAFATPSADQPQKLVLAIVRLDQSAPVDEIVLPSNFVPPYLKWAPDGRSLVYRSTENRDSDLWEFTVKGGRSSLLAHFENELISGFAFSKGAGLAIATGNESNDVVLVKPNQSNLLDAGR